MVYLIESSYNKKSTSMISSILGEERGFGGKNLPKVIQLASGKAWQDSDSPASL